MGIQTDIDVAAGKVVHHISGELTLADVMPAIRALFSNPEFDPSMNILLLIEPGTVMALDAEEISLIAWTLKENPGRSGSGRSAIVASQSADFGVARMLQSMLEFEQREIGVFHDRSSAEAWLQNE